MTEVGDVNSQLQSAGLVSEISTHQLNTPTLSVAVKVTGIIGLVEVAGIVKAVITGGVVSAGVIVVDELTELDIFPAASFAHP